MCRTIRPVHGPTISASRNQGTFVKPRPVARTKTLFQAFCSQQPRDLEAQSVLNSLPLSKGPIFHLRATKAFLQSPD